MYQYCPKCGAVSFIYIASDGVYGVGVQTFCGQCGSEYIQTWCPDVSQFIGKTDPDGGDPVTFSQAFGRVDG